MYSIKKIVKWKFANLRFFPALLLTILAASACPAQEAARADSDHLPAELENKHVRVVRLAVPAHESVSLKGLTVEGVVVSMTQASLQLLREKGAPEMWDATTGSAVSMRGGVGYSLENVGDAAAEVLVVELRDSYGFGQIQVPHSTFDPVELDPKHFHVAVQNELSRVLLVHLGPREVTEKVQFSEGVLINLDDAHTNQAWADGAQREVRQTTGNISWGKDGLYSIQNLEGSSDDFMLLELKRPFCYETHEDDVSPGMKPYIENAKDAVRERWYKAMPREARNEGKGKVIVNWKIQKDGAVRDDDIVVTSAFASDSLVEAAVSAIRRAAPFAPLPPIFQDQIAELNFHFMYNLPLRSPGCD